MNSCSNLYFLSTIACQLSKTMSREELALLSADLVVLSDMIANILVMEEINKLNERDREIIVLRYGLMGHKEMTQKDVADMLGISQSYISRIEKKVIKRLRSLVRC